MKVSIVITTYKHLEDCLKPCLESIIKYTDLTNIEVVVVCNGDGNTKSKQYVESLGEHFRVLFFEEGLGFTRATNIGVKESTGDIIILMNNDCLLLPQEKNTWIKMLCDPTLTLLDMFSNIFLLFYIFIF